MNNIFNDNLNNKITIKDDDLKIPQILITNESKTILNNLEQEFDKNLNFSKNISDFGFEKLEISKTDNSFLKKGTFSNSFSNKKGFLTETHLNGTKNTFLSQNSFKFSNNNLSIDNDEVYDFESSFIDNESTFYSAKKEDILFLNSTFESR